MRVLCISNPELGHFLKRKQRADSLDVDLAGTFRDILTRANDFVPSEAGSIFIENPVSASDEHPGRELVLIACFGDTAERLVGLRLPPFKGIVGHVHATGRAYISSNPAEDPLFLSGFDGAPRTKTHSLVCAPLNVEKVVIGAIELLNRVGPRGYDSRDLKLLEIFAQTISASIANAIDAYRSKEMAKRDELTGLYNDRYLHVSLGAIVADAMVSGSECGLIFLDLDNFKSINDVHGHLAGSRVLGEVGEVMRQVLPGDAIGARYGGDEFVIALPDAGRQELFWVAETVRKNIESFVFLEHADARDPVNYPALDIRGVITCSVGIASLASDVLPVLGAQSGDPVAAKNELIRVADLAMYEAKERGRNRTVTAWSRHPAPAP